MILCAGAVGSPQILQLSGIGQQHAQGARHQRWRTRLEISKTCRIACRSAALTRSRARAGIERAFPKRLPRGSWPPSTPITRRGPDDDGARPARRVRQIRSEPRHTRPASRAALDLAQVRRARSTRSGLHRQRRDLRPTSRGSLHILADPAQHAKKFGPTTCPAREPPTRGTRAHAHRRAGSCPARSDISPAGFSAGPQVTSNCELAQAAGDISTACFTPVGTAKIGQRATCRRRPSSQGAHGQGPAVAEPP